MGGLLWGGEGMLAPLSNVHIYNISCFILPTWFRNNQEATCKGYFDQTPCCSAYVIAYYGDVIQPIKYDHLKCQRSTSRALSSLIWLCTVCSDLSAPILRTFMVHIMTSCVTNTDMNFIAQLVWLSDCPDAILLPYTNHLIQEARGSFFFLGNVDQFF